jgi:hypothetical protein
MTDSMVERVAKAVALRDAEWFADKYPDVSREEIDAGIADLKDNFVALARAAIEAMREPGLAIRKLTTFEFAEIEWPRLIDAALSQAQPTGEKP